jgi:hypothetical protein
MYLYALSNTEHSVVQIELWLGDHRVRIRQTLLPTLEKVLD